MCPFYVRCVLNQCNVEVHNWLDVSWNLTSRNIASWLTIILKKVYWHLHKAPFRYFVDTLELLNCSNFGSCCAFDRSMGPQFLQSVFWQFREVLSSQGPSIKNTEALKCKTSKGQSCKNDSIWNNYFILKR